MGACKRQLFLLLIGFTLPMAYSQADNPNPSDSLPEPQTSKNKYTQKVSSLARIHYIPPATEKLRPEIRVARGGVRSNSDCSDLPTITLLIPNHVAYTTMMQPVFYFHSTGEIEIPVTLTLNLNDAQIDQPLIDKQPLTNKVLSGINEIDLADYGVSFKSDMEYQWVIEIGGGTGDTNRCPSEATGYAMKVNEIYGSEHLKTLDKAKVFAEKSIWLDALAVLINQNKKAGNGIEIQEKIKDFLQQGELDNIY